MEIGKTVKELVNSQTYDLEYEICVPANYSPIDLATQSVKSEVNEIISIGTWSSVWYHIDPKE